MAEGKAEIGSNDPQSFNQGVFVNEYGQILLVNFEPPQLLEHFGRKGLLLLFEAIEIYFEEGLLEVAAKVSDGLHLSSEVIVDEDEKKLTGRLFDVHSTLCL
jgi:hypothetical protein